jgi:hypothetical protein
MTLHNAWQMEKDGLLSQIKRTSFSGEDADYLKEVLTDLIQYEPEIPLLPSLYFEDATQEALALHLANGWPSAALWSDEAGIVLGSHSMQSNPTRFVALLNKLWDGKDLTAHRKTTQSFIIRNRRLTLNLMIQPALMDGIHANPGNFIRQSGFLARCLIAKPKTAMGTRFYQEPPAEMNFLADYEKRLQDCLNQTRHLKQEGCIKLPTLCMSTAAKQKWIQFFNLIESGLSLHGDWLEIKDVASKSSENVARLAALFHLFEGNNGDITSEHVEQAIEIITWHLYEAKGLFTTGALTKTMLDAKKLLTWLIEKDYMQISLRDIQRLSPLRDKETRDSALEILIEHHWVRIIKNEGKSILEVNPSSF